MTDSATIEAICVRHGDAPDALIEILHDVQDALGHVPEAALPAIAGRLNLSRAEVHGVVSFYHDFRTAPGPLAVRVCQGEACQSMGGEALMAALRARGAAVEPVYCLGNCALAPAAMADGRLIGRASAERILEVVR
jgi:formate dehydrogenase subunit gamma